MTEREGPAPDIYHRVAAAMTAKGWPARTENTGGWVICVLVDDDNDQRTWYFGTANETWGGELCTTDGEQIDDVLHEGVTTIETAIGIGSDDAEQIANAIVRDLNHRKATAEPVSITIGTELAVDIRNYLDNRSDIDNDGGPNGAMRLLTALDAAINAQWGPK